jgi:hypothetical protein
MRTRTEPQFFDIRALSPDKEGGFAVLAGAERRSLLSRDSRSRAETWSVRWPASTALGDSTGEATVELLVLAGRLDVDGDRHGVGSFVSLPQGQAPPELRTAGPVDALVYVNPDLPSFGPPLSVPGARATWSEPWVPDVPGSHGLFHKKLRLPDFSGDWLSEGTYDGGPGGYLRLVLIAPGADPRQHVHHECWEELVVLRGDVFIAERGHFGAGSYMGNPQELWHAPFASQGGALCIVHTDGPMGIPFDFRDVPGGDDLVGGYLTGRPLLDEPAHTSWSDLPDAVRWEEDAAVRRWRAEHAPWAKTEAPDGAARFRARWRLDA